MNQTLRNRRLGLYYGLGGVSVFMLLSLTAYLLLRGAEAPLAGRILSASLVSAIVWGYLTTLYVVFPEEREGDESSHSGIVKVFARFVRRVSLNKGIVAQYVLTIVEVLCAYLLLSGVFSAFGVSPSEFGTPTDPLAHIALSSTAILLLIVIYSYIRKVTSTVPICHALRPGTPYFLFIAVHLCTVLACSVVEYATGRNVWHMGFYLLTLLQAIVGAEIVVVAVFKLFSPRSKDQADRPAFSSYTLEVMANPTSIKTTSIRMVNDLLGFDASSTAVFNSSISLVLPTIFFSSVIIAASSAVCFVRPNENACILRWGNLTPRLLRPGLHIKLPFPAEKLIRENVYALRRVHVGSHQPQQNVGEVYVAGMPILWTNKHGISSEEMLLISAPKHLMDQADRGGARFASRDSDRAPSVSLAGADIYVEYSISDLHAYLSTCASPELLMRKLAESQASRLLLRFDIDNLFCEKRIAIGRKLREHVQTACDARGLGVNIVHVGVTAVHPPIDVADAFEETVIARQKKESAISQAMRERERVRIELAGSSETFENVTRLIDSIEMKVVGSDDVLRGVLDSCGGDISRILSEAGAYRSRRRTTEQGKQSRFHHGLHSFRAAPQAYRYGRYCDVIEKMTKEKQKYVLLGDPLDVVIRVNANGPSGGTTDAIPEGWDTEE